MKKNFTTCLYAFSLIELLISLIVVSVITAAFAPVMSKRLSKTTITLGSGDSAITNECTTFGTSCKLCNKDKCLFCDVSCLSNQYKDAANCVCVNCPANCTSCDATGCAMCSAGYKKQGGSCVQCDIGQYSPGNNICITCEGGKYSSTKGATTCQTCEAGYKCTGGIRTLCNGANEYQDVSNQSSCKNCPTGIVTADRKTCKTCAQAFGSECTACSSTTCTACSPNFEASGTGCARSGCPDGTYLSGTTCPACTAFHLKCAKCNATNGCTECAEGYIAVNGKCNKKMTQADCTNKFGGFWDRFNKICVTKRNMGYSANGSSAEKYKEIQIPAEANILSARVKTKCPVNNITTSKCCWFGTTGDSGVNTATNSSDLTAKNGSVAVSPACTYSASKRTLCNWYAAVAICQAYNGGGGVGYWRLPTKEELEVWSQNFSSISKGLGSNGLQLCNKKANTYGAQRCNWVYEGGCKTDEAYGDYLCLPYLVWSGTEGSPDFDGYRRGYYVLFEDESLTVEGSYIKEVAGSVRCVIDNFPSD